MPCVLNYCTTKALGQYKRPARHGVPVVRDAEELSEVICPADERQLDAEVIKQQHLKALPLFLPRLWFIRLDLILLHEREELEDKSRQTEQEVDQFMDDERAPGGDLEFAVVLQHVIPRELQRFLKRILWKK